jgi:choline dehydrogenase-like flavoprotein
MIYMRPSASDYDDWETLYKNPGWGSKDLIPLLRKVRKVGTSYLGLELRDCRSKHTRDLMGDLLTAQMAPLRSLRLGFTQTSRSSFFKLCARLILTVLTSQTTPTRMIWKLSTCIRYVPRAPL